MEQGLFLLTAVLAAGVLPRGVPALVDLAFLPALMLTLARPLVLDAPGFRGRVLDPSVCRVPRRLRVHAAAAARRSQTGL